MFYSPEIESIFIFGNKPLFFSKTTQKNPLKKKKKKKKLLSRCQHTRHGNDVIIEKQKTMTNVQQKQQKQLKNR